jgi:hypothetical protein
MQFGLYCRDILVSEFELEASGNPATEQMCGGLFNSQLALTTVMAALAERAWGDFELRAVGPISVQTSLAVPWSPMSVEVKEIGLSAGLNSPKLTLSAKIGGIDISNLELAFSQTDGCVDAGLVSISIELPADVIWTNSADGPSAPRLD